MTRDAIVFGVSGTMFGLLMGWIIGSQQAPRVVIPTPQSASSASPASAGGASAGAAAPQAPPEPVLDERRAADLERAAKEQPKDAAVRARLADLYYDARRFPQAIQWYEAALAIEPKNVNVSTDLAAAYYYMNDFDRALKQIDHSLAIDRSHAKTLLNQGIILAFGKHDLAGAKASWEKVVATAPGTEEAARARQGLDAIAAPAGPASAPGSAGSTGRN
jgi:cytochrome c-type biogenesis protein CcmH/NrfG